MQFMLIVTCKRTGTSTRRDLVLKEPIVLGRHMESPVPLRGEGLSRRHFALSLDGGALAVEDLSSNGTWLNGIQLRTQTAVRLRPNDVLEVPGYEVRVVEVPPELDAVLPAPRTVPASRLGRAAQMAFALLDWREFLLAGCVLAVLALLGFAYLG